MTDSQEDESYDGQNHNSVSESFLIMPRKIILKDTWQVQREDSHQRGTSAVRPVADDEKTEPKIDFRIHGIPHAAVEQEDDRIREIRRRVRQVKNHPNKDALIAELQNNCTSYPFSEESNSMIHHMEKVECFELCEISPKTQCSSC